MDHMDQNVNITGTESVIKPKPKNNYYNCQKTQYTLLWQNKLAIREGKLDFSR